jgi:hypothetical protein
MIGTSNRYDGLRHVAPNNGASLKHKHQTLVLSNERMFLRYNPAKMALASGIHVGPYETLSAVCGDRMGEFARTLWSNNMQTELICGGASA